MINAIKQNNRESDKLTVQESLFPFTVLLLSFLSKPDCAQLGYRK
jgi:hypothetical protein